MPVSPAACACIRAEVTAVEFSALPISPQGVCVLTRDQPLQQAQAACSCTGMDDAPSAKQHAFAADTVPCCGLQRTEFVAPLCDMLDTLQVKACIWLTLHRHAGDRGGHAAAFPGRCRAYGPGQDGSGASCTQLAFRCVSRQARKRGTYGQCMQVM